LADYKTGAEFFEDSPEENMALSLASDNDPTQFVVAVQISK